MIIQMNGHNVDAVTEMAIALWPDSKFNEERRHFVSMLRSAREKVFLWQMDPGVYAGFIYLALRTFAEGATTSPVGYIEGIYIKPPYRKSGIGRSLVDAGEAWSRELGCREMASDAEQSNEASQQFHIAVGFAEVSRIVCYRKEL
jgi:aminoglycoside 6'-N-acetyltransferase I